MPEQLRLTVRPIGRKDPISLLRRLHRGRWPFFLDSSLPDPELARYSFLGSDPVACFRSRGALAAYASPWGEPSNNRDPIAALRPFLGVLPWVTAGSPTYPFPRGRVGYIRYQVVRM